MSRTRFARSFQGWTAKTKIGDRLTDADLDDMTRWMERTELAAMKSRKPRPLAFELLDRVIYDLRARNAEDHERTKKEPS